MNNFKSPQLFYDISSFDRHIGVKIQQNWGLRRIFSWLKSKFPYHGDSIVLSHILYIGKRFNRKFSDRTILRVINQFFDETIPTEAKKNILDI